MKMKTKTRMREISATKQGQRAEENHHQQQQQTQSDEQFSSPQILLLRLAL